ncbi:MAG: hypothetical protein JWQ30_1556 [Sediminibacterium sp.]|nr:hypothetical protein [Sediminibacterium sp.]
MLSYWQRFRRRGNYSSNEILGKRERKYYLITALEVYYSSLAAYDFSSNSANMRKILSSFAVNTLSEIRHNSKIISNFIF